MDEENDWYYVEHFKMHLHPRRIVEQNELPLKGEACTHLAPARFRQNTTRPTPERYHHPSIFGLYEIPHKPYPSTSV